MAWNPLCQEKPRKGLPAHKLKALKRVSFEGKSEDQTVCTVCREVYKEGEVRQTT